MFLDPTLSDFVSGCAGLWAKVLSVCSFSGSYKSGFASLGDEPVSNERLKTPAGPDRMDMLSHKNFAVNTENKISWATQLYQDWWFERLKKPDCNPHIRWCNLKEVKLLNKANFAISMCSFLSEVRKKDGSDYPSVTLRQLVLMIQFYLEKHGLCWKLLDEDEFFSLRNTLDNLMKERCASGLGEKCSSDAISFKAEELLWTKSVLGSASPDQLHDTVLYLVGLNFALRGGGTQKVEVPEFQPSVVCEN